MILAFTVSTWHENMPRMEQEQGVYTRRTSVNHCSLFPVMCHTLVLRISHCVRVWRSSMPVDVFVVLTNGKRHPEPICLTHLLYQLPVASMAALDTWHSLFCIFLTKQLLQHWKKRFICSYAFTVIHIKQSEIILNSTCNVSHKKTQRIWWKNKWIHDSKGMLSWKCIMKIRCALKKKKRVQNSGSSAFLLYI